MTGVYWNHTNNEGKRMEDATGKELLIGDVVVVMGFGGRWTVMSGQDEFGDVEIKHNIASHTLHRNPQSLAVID